MHGNARMLGANGGVPGGIGQHVDPDPRRPGGVGGVGPGGVGAKFDIFIII